MATPTITKVPSEGVEPCDLQANGSEHFLPPLEQRPRRVASTSRWVEGGSLVVFLYIVGLEGNG